MWLPLNIQGWAILRHPTPDAPRKHPRELKIHSWGLETRENPLSGEAAASPGCPELLANGELPMSDVLATTNGEGIRVHIPQPHGRYAEFVDILPCIDFSAVDQ